jgi:hypothetical protein
VWFQMNVGTKRKRRPSAKNGAQEHSSALEAGPEAEGGRRRRRGSIPFKPSPAGRLGRTARCAPPRWWGLAAAPCNYTRAGYYFAGELASTPQNLFRGSPFRTAAASRLYRIVRFNGLNPVSTDCSRV